MSFVATVLPIATTVYGAYSSSKAAKNAGQQAQQIADPFGKHREFFANPTMDLFTKLMNYTGSDYQDDPMFQSIVQGGIDTVNKGMAAQGMLRSGNRMLELQKVGQNAAAQTVNNRWSQLYSLLQTGGNFAGAGINPATAAELGYKGNMASTSAINSGINALFQGISQGGFFAPKTGGG